MNTMLEAMLAPYEASTFVPSPRDWRKTRTCFRH